MDRYDFTDSIKRLELRSKKSRRRFYIIGVILIVVITVFALMVFRNLFLDYSRTEKMFYKLTGSGRINIKEPFERRINILMNNLIGPKYGFGSAKKFNPPNDEDAKKIEKKIDDAIEDFMRVAEIDKPIAQDSGSTSSWIPIISTGVFSLGAVAFIILLIQIAVMFMRYYARLAELYDAQSDALKASNGDSEKAFKFMEHFSPNAIEIGKTPTTLYEKALDTIQSVAKK